MKLREVIAMVLLCAVFMTYTVPVQAQSALGNQSTAASSQDAGQQDANLEKLQTMEFRVLDIDNINAVTPEQSETVRSAFAVLASPSNIAEKESLLQRLNAAAGNFGQQVEILRTWLQSHQSDRNVQATVDRVELTQPQYVMPSYGVNVPADDQFSNWFSQDGSVLHLIYSSNWRQRPVDEQLFSREDFLKRASVEDVQTHKVSANPNSPIIKRLLKENRITLEGLNLTFANSEYVGQFVELPGTKDNPCLVPIKSNMFAGSGVVHYEVYDKCPEHDPKHMDAVKGLQFEIPAYTDASGTAHKAEHFWIAGVCGNPLRIYSERHLQIKVWVKQPTPQPEIRREVRQEPPKLPPLGCYATDPGPFVAFRTFAGDELDVVMPFGARYISGTGHIYKAVKKDGAWQATPQWVKDLSSAAGITGDDDSGRYALAGNMPAGTFMAQWLITDGLRQASCSAVIIVKKIGGGGVAWWWIPIAIGVGIAIGCALWCGGDGGIPVPVGNKTEGPPNRGVPF